MARKRDIRHLHNLEHLLAYTSRAGKESQDCGDPSRLCGTLSQVHVPHLRRQHRGVALPRLLAQPRSEQPGQRRSSAYSGAQRLSKIVRRFAHDDVEFPSNTLPATIDFHATRVVAPPAEDILR